MTAPKTKPKSHSREIHIVIPRPDATPDQLRQLAAAKELVGRFLRDLDEEDDEASLSMAAHFAHELLWTHRGGAAAKWQDFPVTEYFLETVPYAGVMPPPLCSKLMDETCVFFRWLGESGVITPAEATALCARAESVREEMTHLAMVRRHRGRLALLN